jgi:hypothetical protein
VFEEGPYEGGYDFKIGTSDKGEIIDFASFEKSRNFKHAIVFFGGVEGIEGIIEQEETSDLRVSELRSLFDIYLNTCPEQGNKTLRTEEAIMVSMAAIYPRIREVGLSTPK